MCVIGVWSVFNALRVREPRVPPNRARAENHSTRAGPSARIHGMFRYASVLAASAAADAPKAAVPVLVAAVDGARS